MNSSSHFALKVISRLLAYSSSVGMDLGKCKGEKSHSRLETLLSMVQEELDLLICIYLFL